MGKLITSTTLSPTLHLSECTDGFWLWDKTRQMNLSMRATTATDALVEALHYYQKTTDRRGERAPQPQGEGGRLCWAVSRTTGGLGMNDIVIKRRVVTPRTQTVEIPVEKIEETLRNVYGMPGHKVEVEFDAGYDFLRGAIVTLTTKEVEES